MGSSTPFLYQKMMLLFGIFWASLSTLFLPLFSFFRSYLLRFKRYDSCSQDNPKHVVIYSEQNRGKYSDVTEQKTEIEAKQDSTNFTDGSTEKETPEISFKFKFPTYEEFIRSRGEIGYSISFETEVVSSNPKEITADTDDGSFNDGVFSERDFGHINAEANSIGGKLPEESTSNFCSHDVLEKFEAMTFTNEEEELVDAGKISFSEEIQVHSDSLAMDSDSESFTLSPLRLVTTRLDDSYSDGFLSDGDFGVEMSDFDETHMDDSDRYHKEGEFDEDMFPTEEQGSNFENVGKFNSDFLSEKDFPEKVDMSNDKVDSGKVNSKDTSEWDSEDSNKLEALWEHQELIEQLKNELKKAKTTELPTILEESDESPKMMEELKPWKIDEKFQRVDHMEDLHSLYKIYRERMRKFDVLNYQKMYAIGFLQLKDPLQSISTTQKSLIPSVFPGNFFLSKRKRTGNDPTTKFIEELRSDIEVVYVGQMCLCWEILHWQYGKALDLWESDHRGISLYNEVAGEFQQFQVLMQRFIEDEPFQGPRVQNYVKSRCVLRNLLQVPVIREDTGDRKKAMKRGGCAITNDVLIEIMEESIRIFWRFVRADKDCFNNIGKCWKGHQVELQNPEDSELLMEVQVNLQKKEKKLRDLLRTGNCILKRFQKSHDEDGSDHVLYFFSQVDMKLVARVLNMSRVTTDQLLWCRNKLNKITFVNSKIQVEPSFLLFPF